MLLNKTSSLDIKFDKGLVEPVISSFYSHSVKERKIQPFMYLPYKIFNHIINKNDLSEIDLIDIFMEIPEKYYPFLDPVDREITVCLKQGNSLSEAKTKADQKNTFNYFNPYLFLRTFPLILLEPQNKEKKLEKLTFSLTQLTHKDEVAQLMSYYNIINLEFLNHLLFLEPLQEFIILNNLRVRYFYNNDQKINEQTKFDNETLIYYLLELGNIKLENKVSPTINNKLINTVTSLTSNLYCKDHSILNSSFDAIQKEFEAFDRKNIKILTRNYFLVS